MWFTLIAYLSLHELHFTCCGQWLLYCIRKLQTVFLLFWKNFSFLNKWSSNKISIFKRMKLDLSLRSDQIRSVAQSCPTLCDPMNRSTPGLPVHPQLPEFTQTHIHRVSDAIQPSHPLSSPSPPAQTNLQGYLYKYPERVAFVVIVKMLQFPVRGGD